MVERDQVMVPAGWDSIGKIKVLRSGFDCEGVADGWDMDAKGANDAGAVDGVIAQSAEGARKVYEETIVNPKRSHVVSGAGCTGDKYCELFLMPQLSMRRKLIQHFSYIGYISPSRYNPLSQLKTTKCSWTDSLKRYSVRTSA